MPIPTLDALDGYSPPLRLVDTPAQFASKGDAWNPRLPLWNTQLVTFRDWINGIGTQASADAATASAAATTAQAASQAATNAANTQGTSADNRTIGSGTLNLTINTGKSIVPGQFMVVSAQTDTTCYMIGKVESYNSGTGALQLTIYYVNGTGTFNSWRVFLSTDVTKVTPTGKPLSITADTIALSGYAYDLGASLILTLPAAPTPGDSVVFRNSSGTLTCVIARNGNLIMGLAEDMTIDDLNGTGCLMYFDATKGWRLV